MIAFLAHPYGGDASNLRRAKAWLQWCSRVAEDFNLQRRSPYLDHELFVMAPWIPLCEVLPETDVDQRYGLRGTLNLFSALQGAGAGFEVWCFGKLSRGVTFESAGGVHYGGTVWDFTALGDDPPGAIFDPRDDARAHRITDVAPEWWRIIE